VKVSLYFIGKPKKTQALKMWFFWRDWVADRWRIGMARMVGLHKRRALFFLAKFAFSVI
jgi:hypothetical protein